MSENPVPLPVEPSRILGLGSAEQLSPEAIAAVAAGIPPSTREAYTRDLQEYRRWCESADRTPLPTSTHTLTEYATHLAYSRHLSPSSIQRARWAIRRVHRELGLPVPDTDGFINVLRGYRSSLSEARDERARPRRATAITVATLDAMVSRLDRATPAGCRDAALVLLGFALAGRRSEIASLNIGDIAFADQGVVVSVYRKKTRKHQDAAVIHAKDQDLCPVLAVKEWMEMLAAAGRTSGPLFIRIDRHGNLGPRMTRNGQPIGDPSGRITPQGVGEVIGRKAQAAAVVGRHTGHSLRRGFATESRRAGHSQLRIARGGGWDDNSRVVASYIDDADQWTDNPLKGVL